MAGANELISVSVDDRDLQRVFSKIALIDANMEPLFADIGEYLLESLQQRFADQVDLDGIPWHPLNEKTISRKSRNADKILIEFGDYLRSFHYETGPDHVAFGTNDIRGATLHFGDEDRGIPARLHVGTSIQDDAVILDMAEAYLMELLTT